MDKNFKQAKAAKAKAEEAALNRILCWIVGGSVLEFLLMLLNRYYYYWRVEEINIQTALSVAVKILAVAALACAGAAAFWWKGARQNGKSVNLPATLFFFMLGVSAGCFAAWFFSGPGIQLMYVAVPVVVILALVYYLYQREFFLLGCAGALVLLTIWVCSRGLGGGSAILAYVCAIVSVLAVMAVAALCRMAQTGGGVVEIGGRKRKLFPKDANYPVLYLGCAVALAVLILAVIGLNSMALYAVTAAWLLITAVYYTVKLM